MAVSGIKYTNASLSGATQNMFAARILKDGRIKDYCDDDGEHGGARVILQEFRTSNITNRMRTQSGIFSDNHFVCRMRKKLLGPKTMWHL